MVQTFGRGWPSEALLSTFIAPLSAPVFTTTRDCNAPVGSTIPACIKATAILCICSCDVPEGVLRFRVKSDEKIWIWKNAIISSTPWGVAPRYLLKSAWRTQQCEDTQRGLGTTHLAYLSLTAHHLLQRMHKLLSATRAGYCWGLLCTLYHRHAIMQSLIAPSRQTISEMQKVAASCNIRFKKQVPGACLIAPMAGG